MVENQAAGGISRQSDESVRKNALARPPEERELARRPNRLKPFLMPRLSAYIFDELSADYLKKIGLEDKLAGVPVPLRREDLAAFREQKGLGLNIIVLNMAYVAGIDPGFVHCGAYLAVVEKFLHKKAAALLIKEAKSAADGEDLMEACIFYRAALVLKWDDMDALYGYARVCRSLYNQNEDREIIGNLKAEAFDYLELLTELYPRFAAGWYYLGFMYLNMGLYTKAKLTWESFLLRAPEGEEKKEIGRRLDQIRIPVEIEGGCNAILAGRWQEGVLILERFSEGVYQDWWPLWHYLGDGWQHLDRTEDAIDAFRQLLRLNGTHLETMEKLASLYEMKGDGEMVKKYRDKIQLILADQKTG